jgi:hypothetical protein
MLNDGFEEPMAGKGRTPMENAFLTFVDKQRKAKVCWSDIPPFREWVDAEYIRMTAEIETLRDALERTQPEQPTAHEPTCKAIRRAISICGKRAPAIRSLVGSSAGLGQPGLAVF